MLNFPLTRGDSVRRNGDFHRMNATRRYLALSAAALSLGAVSPAFAQMEPMAGPGEAPYEYAVPAPPGMVYQSGPVIQPLPAPPPGDWSGPVGPDYDVETYPEPLPPPYVTGPLPGPMPAPMAHPGHMAQRTYAAPMHPRFDRAAWLDDCRLRTRSIHNADERASIIGGLLGAVAGGVVGNRVYDGNRLAGSLIGAGVGGLAGLAIGAAIDTAGKRRRADDCAMYLERYMSGGYGQPTYAYGYGYNQGYGYGAMTYMPVLVAVPQRQVVREYVTEEYVDVPVRSRTIHETRVVRERAPAPARHDKRVKLITR